MARSIHLCVKCGTECMGDIPCSNCGWEPDDCLNGDEINLHGLNGMKANDFIETRRIPVDYEAITKETGLRRGRIGRSPWCGWCVQNVFGDFGPEGATITPPPMESGETMLRIEDHEWVFGVHRDDLILELQQLDNPRICRSWEEWEQVRDRQAEICRMLGVEFPEDALGED